MCFDNKIMEDIKLEEKKIQLVDFAIKKIKWLFI